MYLEGQRIDGAEARAKRRRVGREVVVAARGGSRRAGAGGAARGGGGGGGGVLAASQPAHFVRVDQLEDVSRHLKVERTCAWLALQALVAST